LPVLDDALDVVDSLGTDGGPNIEALQKTDVAEVFPESIYSEPKAGWR
jgi:hypothetical protein